MWKWAALSPCKRALPFYLMMWQMLIGIGIWMTTQLLTRLCVLLCVPCRRSRSPDYGRGPRGGARSGSPARGRSPRRSMSPRD